MGTQGSAGNAVFGGRGGVRPLWRPIAILAGSLAVLPLVGGCSGSSFPSFGSANPQSTVPPPPNASVAATGQPVYAPPAAAQRDYSDSLPYPKQSLADVFRGSTETQPQSVPRPPSSYTPSGQPYTPQGQAAGGAPTAGSAAPAGQNPSDLLPYPKQSLFDFSNNK
jgi:hypothetical protein